MKAAFFNVKIVISTQPMNAYIKVNGLKPHMKNNIVFSMFKMLTN
jgi:hypothetical protein